MKILNSLIILVLSISSYSYTTTLEVGLKKEKVEKIVNYYNDSVDVTDRINVDYEIIRGGLFNHLEKLKLTIGLKEYSDYKKDSYQNVYFEEPIDIYFNTYPKELLIFDKLGIRYIGNAVSSRRFELRGFKIPTSYLK